MNTWTQPTLPQADSIRGATMPAPLEVASSETVVPRKKILVVDDSLVVRRLLAMKLKSSGYDVLEAADGPTAASVVRQHKPDLMLLDIMFPADVAHGGGGWDGFQILQWVRQMDGGHDLPIIMITSGSAEEYQSRSMSAGAVGFFRKPINNEELLNTIRLTFGDAASAGHAPAA